MPSSTNLEGIGARAYALLGVLPSSTNLEGNGSLAYAQLGLRAESFSFARDCSPSSTNLEGIGTLAYALLTCAILANKTLAALRKAPRSV